MTMEEMWSMRASSMKSSAQPVPSAPNQFNMDAGQLSQPYMAKEVCVIERTFRQEPMVQNHVMNYSSQGLHPDKLRSELLAMVSGSQQHVTSRSNYTPSMSGRSSYAASLSPMNLPDLGGYGGWPMQSPSILAQANRVDGSSAKTSAGTEFGGMSGGRNQDSFPAVNGSRAPAGTELLNHSSSFGRGPQELGLDGNWHLPSPQWGAESARQRQRQQSAQASTLFSTNSEQPCKGVTSAFNTGSGLLCQSQSAPAPSPSGGLRVYCINYFGVPVVGQLGLTDAGRLGVTCTCHGQHMSVAKFTQHSGLNAANPGEVVYMEGGETLVQWRKSFFSQYGVKVPEDSVGWEWLDVVGAVDSGPGNGKYKAVVTQSWQKEVDVSCGGNTPPVMKSRTTQLWDTSISQGNASTLHAMESISNTKYGSLNTGNGGMVDTREAGLKNYGQSQSYRGASMASDLGSPMSGQFYTASTHESFFRGQGNMGHASTFQSMSHSGHLATNNGHNFTSDGGQRYSWTGQQVSGGSRNGKGASHVASRLSEGQESRTRENDIASSFELRLGQPSQQTQAAGTSFSSIATSSVEHPKSYLFEQIMSKVWDGKLPPNVQQFNPANLPKFSGIPGQGRDQQGARQPVHGNTDRVDSCGVERREEERGGSGYPAAAQSPRQMLHSSQADYKPESGVSELQGKLMALDSFHQSNISSRNGDRQFRGEPSGSENVAAKLFPPHTGPSRSVTLENGTTLDSLSSGALVQLSNKTGQRLLETAIQSSFAYRARGLQGGPVAQPSGSPSSRVNPEGLTGGLDMFGRPLVGGRASFPEFLARRQGQQDSNLGSGMAVDGAKGSRLEQDPNRAFQMQEPGNLFLKHHQQPVHRVVLEEISESGSELERQNLAVDKTGREWQSEEQQGTVNDRPGGGRLQGGPEADRLSKPRLEAEVREAVIPSRLTPGFAESEGNEGEQTGVHSERLAELAGRDAKAVDTETVGVQEGVDVATLSGGNIQCSCLKCRKASPSARGQAVPRLAGQVCLREKVGLASSVEAARKVALGEGDKNAVEDPADVEQPRSMPEEMEVVEERKESSREGFAWEIRREEGVEEVDVKRVKVGAECDEMIPENEDVLSDTAAKGTGRDEAIPEVHVCSNSSENLSSGLSDGDCAMNDKAAPVLVQGGQGTTSLPGVVDEGSGIGKCCSSDDVDMVVGRNPNAFSALEDPCKVVGSPSSLGCPSSSNMGRRLVVKRGGMRGSKEIDDDEVDVEPVASTGKVERKQRRNTKWKWLGSGVDGGDAMEGSLASSFGHEAEPQVTSEDARIGSKLQEAVTKPDALKREFKASSGEIVAPSKRRKLLIPRRHQEVKATNVTEENLEAANLDMSEDSKKKAGTLVIRVPQGVNRQKAKKGIRTKSHLKCDWRSGAGGDAVSGEGEGRRGPEAGKSVAPRPVGRPMKAAAGGSESGSGSARAVYLSPIGLPSFVTKNIRSPRTPLAGPSPRNGRMMSLSVILNQPAEVKQVPRVVDGRAPVQKPRDGVAKLRKEGTLHKRLDAHVGSVNVTGKEQAEEQSGPATGMGVPWKSEGRTRVMHKKEDAQSRKIRSLLELTGKDDVHGPGASGASSVFEFVEDEDVKISRASKHATTALQTDRPAIDGTKSCPFPRGERSVRPGGPNRRKFPEWPRNGTATMEAGKRSRSAMEAEQVASEKAETYECQVSQVRSAAGSSISKEKLQQGFSFPVRKQVRSSKLKRSTVAGEESQQAKDVRALDEGARVPEFSASKHEARQAPALGKRGVTGNGVLKRMSSELDSAGLSAKRPRVVLAPKKVKEAVVSEIEGSMEDDEFLKSSSRGFCSEQKMKTVVEDPVDDSTRVQKKMKSQVLELAGRSSTLRKERTVGSIQSHHMGPAEKCKCDVCGTFNSASYNKLLCCGRCPVKVHQACYGVPKIPKGQWMCRTCKFKVSHPATPICVLCGYGGGAMTRVQKARPLCLTLLQIWRDLKKENGREPSLENDNDETLLLATNNIQLARMRSTGMRAKKMETKVRERKQSCDCEEPRDAGAVCTACRKDSPEPGNCSGGNDVRWAENDANASLGLQDLRNSTVGTIVKDAGAKQWAHMVCTLWMPGTRCLNMGTMGVFDVSGVSASRRKALCSICKRKGGACIQCRVPKCSTPFHVWCAHEKGLLQSEIVQDGTNQVGFFGKCQRHAEYTGSELHDETKEGHCSGAREVCARTEGYKGRLSLEDRAKAQQRMLMEGSTPVTHQQVAAWLRIDERKLCNRRSVVKSASSSSMSDQREYLRFKQKRGWKKLGVYKSGIHALGLYTTDFIAEGEVVVEYVGEIVGLRVADKREVEYHSGKRLQYQGACYLFRIDTEQIIDATRKGGIARFVNHSCSPNCVAKVISVENLKKVVFFAKRDIYAGEEVTYDYKFNCDEVDDKIPCFCGSSECRGTLN